MKLYLKTKDYFYSGEEFELLYDKKRDMLITSPTPKNLMVYYDSNNYISHSDKAINIIDKIYQVVKHYSLSKKVRLIAKFKNNNKTILDIGAGTGDFLLKASKEQWNVFGVEPNKLARDKSSKKGINLKETIEEIEEEKFNVITLWHVLEHLPDLQNQLKNILNLLDKEGALIIAVPNYKSYDAKKYKQFWAAYDVPRHLYHFSKKSIIEIFKEYNMELVKTYPMYFDAFYVSLLSEKYKNKKQNIFKAFLIGLWSNISALRTKQYSSHIYVLKRIKN